MDEAVQPGSPNGAWRNAAFQGYADHMASAEFAHALGTGSLGPLGQLSDLRALDDDALDVRHGARVRVISPWDGSEEDLKDLYAVRAEHPDIALITEDVVGAGRVEMMYMLAEQAVSITMHRFGNHSQSMQRVVDELVR